MFGENVKKRRLQLSMTQEDLAQAVGYTSRSAINKIENGHRDIPYSKIIELAHALKTTPMYLMGWEDNPELPENQEKIPAGKSQITIMRKDGNGPIHQEIYLDENDVNLIEKLLKTIEINNKTKRNRQL